MRLLIRSRKDRIAKSIELSKKFLDLWNDADHEIVEVDDKRERLARPAVDYVVRLEV